MKELILQHMRAEGDQGARVHVRYIRDVGMQAQERVVDFAFALDDKEREDIRWYLEEYLVFPYGEYRNRAARVEALMERKGVELFEAVFSDRETVALYDKVADDMPNTRVTILAEEGDPEGIALPWELMRDPLRGAFGDLARRAHAFVRSQPDLIFETPERPATDTFNILMVICRPDGPDKDVPFQSVARPLLELFRNHRDRIRLDILRPPTLEELARVLGENPGFYHVVHFDGHGTFPQAPGGTTDEFRRLFYESQGARGQLAFENRDGTTRFVSGEELGGVLVDKKVPMVLLNACQSGMTHPEALYPSVGNQLLKAGVGGVVAMAYSVYVTTAVRFMSRLYEGLMNGEELGHAVSLAREELRTQPERPSSFGPVRLNDWVVPVLFEAQRQTVLAAKPARRLHLSPDALKEEQAAAGLEVNCPPRPDFGFIGRDGVMLDLERAFQRETIVLLEGMAGVGKTETAMGCARWRGETGALGGPVFFTSFERHTTLEAVLSPIGRAFERDIKSQLGMEWHLLDTDQRRKIALMILRQVPCLLIWDNFEPVSGFPSGTASDWTLAEQGELRQFLHDLRGGATKVLLTSRRDEPWLGAIYRNLPLRGLRLREAQELAGLILGRVGIDTARLPDDQQYRDDYNALLRHLQGNPLALHIILPELKTRKPGDLLNDLKTGEAKLSADDAEQGRTRSLAASLDYRLDRLDPDLRQRLAVLGLFQGFVDADVLAIMSSNETVPEFLRERDRVAWIRDLDAAAEVGLLRQAGNGYYTVHPALPWFLHDLLTRTFGMMGEEITSAYSRAYNIYGAFLQDLIKNHAQIAVVLLQSEEANLMHSVQISRRKKQLEGALGCLSALSHLMEMQSRWEEWSRLVIELEKEVTNTEGGPLPEQEKAWQTLFAFRAQLASHQRDFKMANSMYHRLIEYYRVQKDDTNHAIALHQLGMIAQELRDFNEAERLYRESLSIKKGIGDDHGKAGTLHQLGMIAEEHHDFDAAEKLYKESLSIKKSIGDESGMAVTLHNLGVMAQERHDFDDAEQWFEAGLAINEAIGNDYGKAGALHQLGMIAQYRCNIDDAEHWYKDSLSISERIGNSHGKAITLHQLGMIAEKRQDLGSAKRWYKESLTAADHISDYLGKAQTLYQLGVVAEKQDNLQEAEAEYHQSAAIFHEMKDSYHLGVVQHSLQRVQSKMSESDRAE